MNQVGEVEAEKFFSVVVETSDGTTKFLPVRGETTGQVFQQVKQQPDVRRVGKVSEITREEFDDIAMGRELKPSAKGNARKESQKPPERSDKWIGHVIAGPRVISHARPSGGEQPFKHLQPPPERPKPAKRDPEPSSQRPAVRNQAKLAVTSQQSLAARPTAVSALAPTTVAEYRILKSRRQAGPPYLLQRGIWQQIKGKRIFKVEWEHDFETRELAEQHQASMG